MIWLDDFISDSVQLIENKEAIQQLETVNIKSSLTLVRVRKRKNLLWNWKLNAFKKTCMRIFQFCVKIIEIFYD